MSDKKRHVISSTAGIMLLVVGMGGIVYMGTDYMKTSSFTGQEEVELQQGIRENETVLNTEDVEYHSSSLSLEALDADQKVEVEDSSKNTIQIPSQSIVAPVAEGTDMATLKYNIGHFENTDKMGGKGNFAVAGHSSTIYNCLLNGLEDVKLGDEIIFYNSKKEKFVYYCTEIKVVDPTDMTVLDNTNDSRCTIITCTNNGTMRLCVIGRQMDDAELKKYRETWYSERVEGIKDILQGIEGNIKLCDLYEE